MICDNSLKGTCHLFISTKFAHPRGFDVAHEKVGCSALIGERLSKGSGVIISHQTTEKKGKKNRCKIDKREETSYHFGSRPK